MTRIDFSDELEKLIARCGMDKEADTQAWVLARHLVQCLDSFNLSSRLRERTKEGST